MVIGIGYGTIYVLRLLSCLIECLFFCAIIDTCKKLYSAILSAEEKYIPYFILHSFYLGTSVGDHAEPHRSCCNNHDVFVLRPVRMIDRSSASLHTARITLRIYTHNSM